MFKTQTLNWINDWINNNPDSEIASKGIKSEILNQSVVITTQSLSMVIRCITMIVRDLTINTENKGDTKSLMMLVLINQSLKVLPGRDGIYISF